ncbi:MAG: YibE/F family protein [Pseudonocardiaceae bacterium]|nr:YibE/F family protein [Pseudonocardiaceae bacterium]
MSLVTSSRPNPDASSGRHRHRHRQAAAGPQQLPAASGHGHGHGDVAPASRRVRILLTALLVPFVLASLIGVALTWPGSQPETRGADLGFGQRPVPGEVTAATPSPCSAGSTQRHKCVALSIRLDDGAASGSTIRQILPDEPSTPEFATGDRVVLAYAGGDPTEDSAYQLRDFQRGAPLAWLAVLFAAAVLLLGRWKGLASLAALGFSFVVLIGYVLPAILAGSDPVTVGVLGAGVIMFGTLYLAHGVSAQTSTAVLGTLLSLGLIMVLGRAFTGATRMTGLGPDTQDLVGVLGTGIDARGLLLAGVIIGALGVLDDVTVTQTSAVWELRRASPDLATRQLYAAALRIGRDHISSAVNTLALAYAGAALPLLLAYSVAGQTFGTLITAQEVAQEVVRTLVGSIGLVAAVPITTAIAALVARRDTAATH